MESRPARLTTSAAQILHGPRLGANVRFVGVAAVGLMGVVVIRVRGGDQPGEVRVVHGGLPHVYIAYAEEPLPVGSQVLVINDRGARRVDVEPWNMPGQDVVDVAGQPGRP
ncbi:MAG: hypothetical protein QOE54_4721 [Streptosporangiaceae bacterium]|nr:hypothetical protein [Streptosporangiaceae bacterium]